VSTESTAHVAATESTAAAMSSSQSIRRNRHCTDQQSRSSYNTNITFHGYLHWFDQFALIIHQHIRGKGAGAIKLQFSLEGGIRI
jgi:hypothetical protein